MSDIDEFGFDNASGSEEVETEKPRNEKEEASSIRDRYRKCTDWKKSVKPDDMSRLGKYSVGKLNGFEKCKDIIQHCCEITSREQFKKDLDELTALEFSTAYSMPVMASAEE